MSLVSIWEKFKFSNFRIQLTVRTIFWNLILFSDHLWFNCPSLYFKTCDIFDLFFRATSAVIWPKYCRYGVKHYIINQSIRATVWKSTNVLQSIIKKKEIRFYLNEGPDLSTRGDNNDRVKIQFWFSKIASSTSVQIVTRLGTRFLRKKQTYCWLVLQ